jgi:hypothetical protein
VGVPMRALVIAVTIAIATATAHAHRPCEEVSSIVGHQHCATFGNWGTLDRLPGLEIDTEIFHERFGLGGSLVAARGAGEPTTADLNGWGVRERLAWKMFGPSYLGIELDMGGIDNGARVSPLFAGRLVGGVHALVTSDFMISAELAAGGRTYAGNSGGVLEARGRVDWWATPHLTVGASVGTSLIDRDDHTLTFGLGGHLRAFDGGY